MGKELVRTSELLLAGCQFRSGRSRLYGLFLYVGIPMISLPSSWNSRTHSEVHIRSDTPGRLGLVVSEQRVSIR